jgi:hypothetical protein
VDVPTADSDVGIFMARCIVDERLPVSYVKDAEVSSDAEINAL